MHEQRQDLFPVLGIAADSLPGARFPFDDWIDSFQMARVRRESDLDFRARSEPAHGPITEMIFHVAIASDQIRNVILAKLGEDDLERFPQKIRKDVEPSTMRHAHANLLDAAVRAFVEDCFQSDHQRFRSL